MIGINSVTIVGNLGADPIRRETPGGKAVVNMRVGINGYQGRTDWVTVVAWNALAEACAKHLQKGALVGVQGRLISRRYERDGIMHSVVEIVATHISFLSTRSTVAAAGEVEDIEAPEDMGF